MEQEAPSHWPTRRARKFYRTNTATFQMLCTICTLPGHLPCVHETSDFRQRKLVIETFGWLAFKEWFREPDFWRYVKLMELKFGIQM